MKIKTYLGKFRNGSLIQVPASNVEDARTQIQNLAHHHNIFPIDYRITEVILSGRRRKVTRK